MKLNPVCYETAPCFAKKTVKRKSGETAYCTLLVKTYSHDICPFCKEKRDYTHGKQYPYDASYSG